MSGGFLGELFASLSFSGALVASASFFMSARSSPLERKSWHKIGASAFAAHGIGVFGVIATLFYLIYTHQYQYHYVWSHSSNELPVYYMISCFWEGQEGSFLLWTFWHVVLGGIVYLSARSWRDIVLAVICSVNLILASMILGVYVPTGIGKLLFVLALLVPLGYLLRGIVKGQDSLRSRGILSAGAVVMGVLAILLTFSNKAGFYGRLSWAEMLSFPNIGYLLALAYGIVLAAGLMVFAIVRLSHPDRSWRVSGYELMACFALTGLGLVSMLAEFGTWKVGSTPFLLLRDAFKEAPIFLSNPDFVPANGNGLNPLLQNYWMVIHPPTLFLGFASTVVPFAFVIGALILGKYREWIRPASPWMIFSVAILGVGIIMGGYWAYETLNFGGYWNWDPVENSSLVPWIVGIAALHGIVAYRKSKAFLGFSMAMIVSVFLLVLYSTFLTRSGVLGETSVHTFTDLGLSGQLLLLLFVFLLAIIALFVAKAGEIPAAKKSIPINSAEFVVFLGVLTLIFIGLVVTVFTSIPVFNRVFGTAWATPVEGAFFYYRWTIWFAIALAILSAAGQFMFWKKVRNLGTWNSLARPYILAVVVAVGIITIIAFNTDWQFGFDSEYSDWKLLADESTSPVKAAFGYVRWAFFLFADEIVLFASLFMVLANGDILTQLLRSKKKGARITGGSVAHVGFGLMILGILFSSGFDQVLSQNSNPNELAALAADSRNDNVLLQRGRPRNIRGYQVTYLGKKEAKAPISDLRVIQEDATSFKVRFRDATRDVFAYVLPRDVFLNSGGEVDLPAVTAFLNDKIEFLKPKHINERTLYGLQFVPHKRDKRSGKFILDTGSGFVLYPEAEVNPNMGLIAHPSRKILPSRDIYVHVSTIPKEEDEPKFQFYPFSLVVGDTAQTGRTMLILDRISSDPTHGTEYELIARAHIRVITDQGQSVEATPLYRIDRENRVSIKDHYLDEVYTSIAFVGVNTETGKISLQVQERTNPPDDIVVIQAIQKPWINFLWLGTFVLTFGFGMAIYRRIRESRAGEFTETEETEENPIFEKVTSSEENA